MTGISNRYAGNRAARADAGAPGNQPGVTVMPRGGAGSYPVIRMATWSMGRGRPGCPARGANNYPAMRTLPPLRLS